MQALSAAVGRAFFVHFSKRSVSIMSDISPKELAHLAKAYRELIACQQTVLLSTVSVENLPQISYAPYVQDQAGTFYIYVSELAPHTANLLKNRQASILFIRPEAESVNLFARERVVFHCRVHEVERSEDHYTSQLQTMREKFGEVIEVLGALPDFHLLALTPEKGQYVVGFGRAFRINVSEGTLSH